MAVSRKHVLNVIDTIGGAVTMHELVYQTHMTSEHLLKCLRELEDAGEIGAYAWTTWERATRLHRHADQCAATSRQGLRSPATLADQTDLVVEIPIEPEGV